MRIPLNLQFKGDRDYLTGADMLNATVAILQQGNRDVSRIDFAFHRMARNALVLSSEDSSDCSQDKVAECSYELEGKNRRVFLYETLEPVLGSYPYDEESIARDFEIFPEDLSGVLVGNPGFTNIEIWVALTKALHQKSLSEIPGKWLFVRGHFHTYAPDMDWRERRLRIVSNFQNKLTRTELHADGCLVGEIFFSII